MNHGPKWPDRVGWTIGTTPRVHIGVFEGDPVYQPFQVSDALFLSAGRLAIANGGTHQIRLYAADGSFLKSLGGEGEGPGEFMWIGELALLSGDTLLAWDPRLGRMSLFAPDGSFVRSATLRGQGEHMLWRTLIRRPEGAAVLLGHGRFIRPGDRSGVIRHTAAHFLYGLDGSRLDSVGSYPGPTNQIFATESTVTVGTAPFGASTSFAATGGRFYVTDGTAYEVRGYAASGRLEQVIRLDRGAPPVTAQNVEEYRETRLRNIEGMENPGFRESLRRLLEQASFPDVMPAYDDLIADATGALWAAPFQPRGESRQAAVRQENEKPVWDVFDSAGVYLGAVTLPRELDIYEIGVDYLLAGWTDELDIQHVGVFPLDRTSVSDRDEEPGERRSAASPRT